jgi:Initiator Replication protein
VILVELSQILEAVSHGVEKGIRSDSASGSTSAQKPILDRILSDVLFLVRFPSEVMELAGRRTSWVLRIAEGELVKVSHLKSRVIDQAKKELDAKSRISFKAEPWKTGRKITGWEIQSDRQQSKTAKGEGRR